MDIQAISGHVPLKGSSRGPVAVFALIMVLGGRVCEEVACAQIPCRYEVRFVGADFCGGFGTPVTPRGMNDLDPPTVVGLYHPCPGASDHPFYWVSDHLSIVPMGLPPTGGSAVAEDANSVEGGLGVGQIVVDASGGQGFLWDEGKWISIPPPAGESYTNPHAIAANKIMVAGTSGGKSFKAFRWDGMLSQVLYLPYGDHQFGWAISGDGSMIAGAMWNSDFDTRAFIWESGKVTDPGWLSGSTVTDFLAINDFGEAAGRAVIPDPEGKCSSLAHAIVWRMGALEDIGTLPHLVRSFALDLNNSCVVVGLSSSYDCGGGGSTAIVWTNEVGMINLRDRTDLGPNTFLVQARAINEKGEIACYALDQAEGVVALLTPVPRKGDVNCDEIVNVDDLLEVINRWGPCRGCQADLTEDWVVNADDLVEVIVNWSS